MLNFNFILRNGDGHAYQIPFNNLIIVIIYKKKYIYGLKLLNENFILHNVDGHTNENSFNNLTPVKFYIKKFI